MIKGGGGTKGRQKEIPGGLGRVLEERLASSRTGENPSYGMNRGGGGNEGKTWWPFATMLERAETQEAIGLNCSHLHPTRPLHTQPCNQRSQDQVQSGCGSMATLMTAS